VIQNAARAYALAFGLTLAEASVIGFTLAEASVVGVGVGGSDSAFALALAIALAIAIAVVLVRVNALPGGADLPLPIAEVGNSAFFSIFTLVLIFGLGLGHALVSDASAVVVRGARPPGRITRGLIALAVRLLPIAQRPRYGEEFGVEFSELPRRQRGGYALRVLANAWELRRALVETVCTPDGEPARQVER
jgi:hypothetical protein